MTHNWISTPTSTIERILSSSAPLFITIVVSLVVRRDVGARKLNSAAPFTHRTLPSLQRRNEILGHFVSTPHLNRVFAFIASQNGLDREVESIGRHCNI